MFDDSKSRGRVNLGGKSAKSGGSQSRDEFLKRQKREREARELERIRFTAAKRIQVVYRSHRCLRAAGSAQRSVFDKRHSDIRKVEAVLPADAYAKFVFRAVVPMLRQVAFFFSSAQDLERLRGVLQLVSFSAQQPEPFNFLHLALSTNDEERMSCVVLCGRLVSAMVVANMSVECIQFLQSLRRVLFIEEGKAIRPVDTVRSPTAMSYLLRRTDMLLFLSNGPFLEAASSIVAAPDQTQTSVGYLLALCASGLVVCDSQSCGHLCTVLLSAPELCTLVGGLHEGCFGFEALVSALPASPPELTSSLNALLEKQIHGASRRAWLFANVLAVLNRIVLGDMRSNRERLLSWLSWAGWAQALQPATGHMGSAAPYVALLDRADFAKALLQGIGNQDAAILAHVLRLMFAPGGAAEGCREPAAEVINALAFATHLTALLFPSLKDATHGAPIKTFYEKLGPPNFVTDLAAQLRALCLVYTQQLSVMYDSEFCSNSNPLRPDEIDSLAVFLNKLAYHLISCQPDKRALPPPALAVRSAVTGLVGALHNRSLGTVAFNLSNKFDNLGLSILDQGRQYVLGTPETRLYFFPRLKASHVLSLD